MTDDFNEQTATEDELIRRGWYWADRWREQNVRLWTTMWMLLGSFVATNAAWAGLMWWAATRSGGAQ